MNTSELKTRGNMDMAVAIAGDMLEVGKRGDMTMDDVNRVSELVRDAFEDAPKTDLGIKLKASLAEEIAKGQDSKYYQIDFDFNVHMNEVARPALVELIKMLGRDEAIIGYFGANAEQEQAQNIVIDKLALDLFGLIEEKVPVGYYDEFFKNIKDIFSKLEAHVVAQVDGHRNEILSRVMGAKNPKYKKFDSSHATYRQVKDVLEKVRQDTGNDPKDYFAD